jgi:hypothetical protein
MARPNFRMIFTIAVIVSVLLFAVTVIGLGYLEATAHAIGKYAPVGDPVNGKHK